ncbi:MAG: ABC transporter substrate-binding protein [Chloroflexi bacterium]|nr:ABC transporter substrate-binding protein [Chloroflexota bacterium]
MPRRPLATPLLPMLLLLTVACSGTAPTAPPDGTDAATGGGGTLVVAIDSDPGHLNPAITTSGATHTASELIYNGLVELGPELEPLPELAESWTVEEDGAVYRFKLRDGVTWHDGEPFTSADVKFSFEEVLLQFHSRTRASVAPVLDAIETPDELTVVFRFTEPYAPLLGQLDVTEAPIVAQHVYEGSDPQENPANIAPIGTGPFRFVSYTPDSEVRLAANPDYWKPDLPKLDQVVMRVNPEKGSQVIALEAGDVQWLWGLPGPDQPRLADDPDIEFLRTDRNPGGSNCIMTVAFNLELPMFADVNVRKAIAHALDRDAFLERVLFGEGRVAEAPISSGIAWAHAPDLDMPGFDMAEAERLLDEAGWTREGDGTRTAQGVEGIDDGTPLAFDFVHFPTFARYGELLRTQLQQVGAEVELRPLEPPVFAPTVFTERDFDTNIISYCNGTDPEIGVRRMFDSAQIGEVPFSNAAAYENADVDRLFAEAASTVDQAQRAELYREIQEIVVAEQPYVWIVETSGTRAFRTTCSGFKPYGLFAEAATCSQ